MARKDKNRKSKGWDKQKMANSMMAIFSNSQRKIYNYKQISKYLGVKDEFQKQMVLQTMEQLVAENQLEEVETGKFRYKTRAGYLTGKIDMTQYGYAYLQTDELEEDVFIARNMLNTALDGDTVKIHVFPKRSKSSRIEGEVIQVIKRERTNFVGIIEISHNFAFLVADNKKMPYDIFLRLDKLKGGKNGQKAIARILEWPKNAKNPVGEIVQVLGNPGENEVEMHAILAEFDLPIHFPHEVEREAEHISDKITREDYENRRDFRNTPTFTIDPHDAKDFDDALSLTRLKNGNWEVGVHIADVTHYVSGKTLIEEEASERATSIYLVDRVVPMLPERLSNFICSLRPQEEKLCFSAVFEMNQNAEVISEWFGRTIIKSKRRFSYEDAQGIIMGGEGDLKAEILTLHGLAQKLRADRFRRGSIAFERVEVKFYLDEKGKPTGVYFKEQKESNQLIEEFMLLANRSVATFVENNCRYIQDIREKKAIKEKVKTFVYRVHDNPNAERLESFANFIRKFGYSINTGGGKTAAISLNKLLDDVQGKKEQNVVETLALRAMAKAKYSTDNIGHYGLAFKNYTHFTSPIRRYPDMMVHRMLAHYLEGGESKNKIKYESRCEHSSIMEKKAMDAERASVKYKQVEFMMDKIGKEFDGIISGLTDWGIYVELTENKCEGMVSVQSLNDDFYEFDEDNYCLTGRKTKKKYQLGDEVKIEVKNVNLVKRQMDFVITGEDNQLVKLNTNLPARKAGVKRRK
jgi:ribonuclease R